MSEPSLPDDVLLARRSRVLEMMTTLSANESEVLARKEGGQTHKEIAAEMDIAKGTVDSHSHRGRKKYNLAKTTLESIDFYEEDD